MPAKLPAAFSLQAFLSPSGINDFPNSSVEDVAAALPTLRSLRVPVMVHAELVDNSLQVEARGVSSVSASGAVQ